MLLNEFFGRSLNLKNTDKKSDESLREEVFQYVLEHDRLHKDYFFPVARKIRYAHAKGNNGSNYMAEFMPMVKKGCLEFYHKNKMTGKPDKVFPRELQEELCEKLYNHYYEDIIKGQYKV